MSVSCLMVTNSNAKQFYLNFHQLIIEYFDLDVVMNKSACALVSFRSRPISIQKVNSKYFCFVQYRVNNAPGNYFLIRQNLVSAIVIVKKTFLVKTDAQSRAHQTACAPKHFDSQNNFVFSLEKSTQQLASVRKHSLYRETWYRNNYNVIEFGVEES